MSETTPPDRPTARRPAPIVVAGLMAVLLLGAGGCSTFNSEWEFTADDPAPRDPLAGRWVGAWSSDANGHHGKLRAIVYPQEEPGVYRAHFHATWSFVSGSYTTELRAVEPTEGQPDSEGTVYFEGSQDLGWPYGEYHYDGYATGEKFHSTYRTAEDFGLFQMRRP